MKKDAWVKSCLFIVNRQHFTQVSLFFFRRWTDVMDLVWIVHCLLVCLRSVQNTCMIYCSMTHGKSVTLIYSPSTNWLNSFSSKGAIQTLLSETTGSNWERIFSRARSIMKRRWYLLDTKETWLIGVCATRPVVCKPKVSMTSLCLTAAPDCRTSQSKGGYR